MAIDGTREAPDGSETGRETLSLEPLGEETRRTRRKQFVRDWFD
jgi:hypothetical protein